MLSRNVTKVWAAASRFHIHTSARACDRAQPAGNNRTAFLASKLRAMGNRGTGIGGMRPATAPKPSVSNAKPTAPRLNPHIARPSFGAAPLAKAEPGNERAARDEEIQSAVITLISLEGVVEGARPLAQVLRELDRDQFTLMVVDPQQTPPACRVFSRKLLYERERQAKRQKKTAVKAAKPQVVRLNANIGDHDFEIKLRKVVEFLEKGRRVTVQIEERSRKARMNARTEERAAKIMLEVEGKCSVVNPPGVEANVWSVALQGKAVKE